MGLAPDAAFKPASVNRMFGGGKRMRSRLSFGFAFAAVLVLSVPVGAQPVGPRQGSGAGPMTSNIQHPVVRLFQQWLHEMETADDPTYTQFVREHISGPGGPDLWLGFRNIAQGTKLYSVKSTTADAAELWLFDPNMDTFVTASAKLVARDGNKIEITQMQLTREVPPGAAPPARLQGAALIKAFGDRAAQNARKDSFSGAVLLARNGEILFERAYGLADRGKHQRNNLNTEFRFGSMGKMFTAVSIMQLVERGKVDLSAPLGRYLPGYPNQDVATKVTVSNLLTHTGGTGDIFGPEFDARKSALRSHSDYVDLYGKRSVEFAPGSRSAYSNYGFILLGRIIEEVSGLTYEQYIQQNIFTPASMKSTGNMPESEQLLRRAVAYMGFGANLKRADETLPFSGTSAGGGYSTVGDFNRFTDGLTSHRLLRAETLQELMTGGVTATDGTFYPNDFGGTLPGSGRYIGHAGGAPGQNGELLHFLESGYTIVVLANRDPPSAQSIAAFIAKRIPTK